MTGGKSKKRRVSDENGIDAIKAVVTTDNRASIDFISKEVGISSSSVHRMLREDLGLRKLSSRWILHILTQENKGVRLDYAQQLLDKYKNADERRLSEIVTGDETWIYFYEPFRKQQNMSWLPKGSTPTKTARRNKSAHKVMYTIFFNSKGIVAQIPCMQNETIT